jgi:hypothetical protein
MAGAELPPTAPSPVDLRLLRRARLLRRIGIGFLAAFVLCGAVGVFGIRTSTVSASGGGYRLTVDYPLADRPGQPASLVVTVQRSGGFPGSVDLSISQSYLNLLDMNDVEPSPSDSRSSGQDVVWTFSKPDDDTLRVTIDAAIQLNTHFGGPGVIRVLDHGAAVTEVHFNTWVAP